MGLTDSPYWVVRDLIWEREWIMGNGIERYIPNTVITYNTGNGDTRIVELYSTENTFLCLEVKFKIPLDAAYLPRTPWVSKCIPYVQGVEGVFYYIDDCRPMGIYDCFFWVFT